MLTLRHSTPPPDEEMGAVAPAPPSPPPSYQQELPLYSKPPTSTTSRSTSLGPGQGYIRRAVHAIRAFPKWLRRKGKPFFSRLSARITIYKQRMQTPTWWSKTRRVPTGGALTSSPSRTLSTLHSYRRGVVKAVRSRLREVQIPQELLSYLQQPSWMLGVRSPSHSLAPHQREMLDV